MKHTPAAKEAIRRAVLRSWRRPDRRLPGEKHWKWSKTGRKLGSERATNGRRYWLLRIHDGRRYRWRMEHVLCAERVLGRRLKRGEVVHHINGDTTDNRNKNLLVCTHGYHMLLHWRMAHAWMREHLRGV